MLLGGSVLKPRTFCPTIVEGAFYSSDEAVDGYHRVLDDIELFTHMGWNVFRLSINRARIYPNGNDSEPNEGTESIMIKYLINVENIILILW